MEPQKGRIASRKTETGASTLPEIGKIKIGEKKTNAAGKEYPSAIDYFRVTGTFAAQFTAKFGTKPKELKIVFLSDSIEEVCNERFECWKDGKRWGYGDGETFTVWATDKYISDIPKTDPRVTALAPWDQMLTLRFVLLELSGIMGYFTFQTKAKAVSIPAIVKSFDFVKDRAGTVIGFPFSLIVEKKKGYNPGEPKNYPVVSLVPNFTEQTMSLVQNYIEAGGSMNRLTSQMIANNELPKAVLEIGEGKK